MFKARLERIQEVQLIRDRIARDLHDDLGSTMSAITIYGSVLQKKLKGKDEELIALASDVHRSAMSASASILEIVWAEDPSKDSLAHLVLHIRDHLNSVAEPAGIQGNFIATGKYDGVELQGPLRRELYLICKEAINNAVKYSGARSITIHLDHLSTSLSLRIEDDGIGFDQELGRSGNGLRNMFHRANLLNADLTIDSVIGAGTVVIIKLNL
jgi:signal transduction histidine kinase